MNVGFSNLASFKAQMLAPSLLTRTDWDSRLTLLGKGVANQFEKYCDRKFMRAIATTETFGADRTQFLLSRLPVEAVTKSELKVLEADGWVEKASTFIRSIDAAAGIIYLPDGSDPGPYYAQVRFTYTGGYFWETLEPTDVAYPTAVPAAATTLPEDLLMAWVLQCKAIWESIDKTGAKITDVGSGSNSVTGTLSDLKFIPEVKSVLQQYVRYSMT